MTSLLVEPPDEFSREAYVRALREAEALPDEDPDKAELVAVRRADLETYFNAPPRTADERAKILRGFMPDGPS
jgi:hypothetical protein